MSQNHFFLRLSFSSDDPLWVRRYLTNHEFRLTAILRQLKNEFWENFALQRRISIKHNQLLLRTKHTEIERNQVVLSQIYREKAGYEKFLADACGDICLEDLLKEQGINTLREESLVSTSFGPQLVDEVQKHPHIIQYLIEEWRPSEVVIGDPLKLGKLYLPDPEKK